MSDELSASLRDALELLLARAPDLTLLVDRTHRVVWANHLAWTRRGPRRLGDPLAGALPQPSREQLRAALEDVFTTDQPSTLEVGVVEPGAVDETRRFAVRLWPVKQVGAAARVLVLATDITTDLGQRRAFEREREALRQSEQRFRTLVDFAPDAMVIFDVDTGRYVDVNANACRLYGLAREQLLERGPIDLSPELQPDGSPSRAAAMTYIERALAGETPSFEWTHLTASGAPVPCEIRLVRLPHPERRLVRGSMTDISERKRAEEERQRLTTALAQAQKLQALGQLTGGVAHDFNNLLTVIMSCLELVSLDAPWPELVRAHAEEAMEAARRAAALTQRLLAFARRQPLRPQALDVNRLVTDTGALLRRTLGQTIAIRTDLSADLWPCQADPTQLENALLNLAINARDAMPDGGQLTIATTNAELAPAPGREDVPAGPCVVLAIRDTGIGMNAAVLGQVFEPFFTTKDVGRGSGLGLSMVYGFVKQSGGHVDIESAPGEGTTVRLFLPRAVTPALDLTPARPPAIARGGARLVLVVEDDATVRALVVAMLERLGYRTSPHADADAALTTLRDNPDVALLLSDVVLAGGGMSGVDLARHVARLRPELPILLMSGFAEDALALDDHLHPDVALLPKPFTQAELAAALEDTLGATHATPG